MRRAEPAVRLRRSLEWGEGAREYKLYLGPNEAELITPDGQVLAVPIDDVAALARASYSAARYPAKVGKRPPPAKPAIRGKLPPPGQPAMTGKRWEPGDDSLLRKEWTAGCTLDALARQFERPRGGVISRLVRLALGESADAILAEDARRGRWQLPAVMRGRD